MLCSPEVPLQRFLRNLNYLKVHYECDNALEKRLELPRGVSEPGPRVLGQEKAEWPPPLVLGKVPQAPPARALGGDLAVGRRWCWVWGFLPNQTGVPSYQQLES